MNNLILGIKRQYKRRLSYKLKYESIWLNNRWKKPYYSWGGTRVFVGIGIRYFSNTEFDYYIALLGFELRVFFKKVYKESQT
jgi:hypothetical protein